MFDSVMASWDAGPFPTILAEAGGRFTSVAGEITIHGKSGVSTNGRLHDQVLEALAER
jgi:histidinol-phosphatase